MRPSRCNWSNGSFRLSKGGRPNRRGAPGRPALVLKVDFRFYASERRPGADMRYKIAALGTALIAAFVLAACKPGGADQGPVIKIGSAAPLTGEIAHLGKDKRNGPEWRWTTSNAAGGVKLGDKTYRLELAGKTTRRTRGKAPWRRRSWSTKASGGHRAPEFGTRSLAISGSNVVQISPRRPSKVHAAGIRTTIAGRHDTSKVPCWPTSPPRDESQGGSHCR